MVKNLHLKSINRLLPAIMLFLTMATWGQTTYTGTYTFTGTTGNVASFDYNGTAITNLTVSALTKVGVTTSSSSSNFRASNWPTGSNDGGAAGGSINTGKYFEFTITAASGYAIANPTLTFGVGRSATGTRKFEWRSSVDNFATAIPVTTANGSVTQSGGVITTPDANAGYTGNVASLSTTGQTTVTFRFYAYGSEGTGGTGGLQGNFSFGGTLQPLVVPGTATLPVITASGTENGLNTYWNTASVSLSTSTADATIYYTTDGSTPTATSNVYTAPFNVTTTTTVNAIATASGLTDSEVASKTITITNPATAVTPYSEAFSNTLADWYNYSVTGNIAWGPSANGAAVNGYNVNPSVESWLISPAFSAGDYGLVLSFTHASAYTGDGLQVKYSTNYLGYGAPSAATWTTLTTQNAVTGPVSSGDIAALTTGTVHFALVYTGSFGNYSNWTISNLTVEDVVNEPAIFVSPDAINTFSYGQGAGPSEIRTFTVNATNLDGSDLVATAGADYEVSLTGTPGDFTATVTLPYTGTSVTDVTVYVRLKAGLTEGTYNQQITLTSGTAVATVAVNGTVTPTPPANDTCAAAAVLTPNAGPTAGTLVNATVASPFEDLGDVWYTFTATTNTSADYSIRLSGYNGDADLYLFEGTCPANEAANVAGSFYGDPNETINYTVTPGAVYYVRVSAYDAQALASGFTIEVSYPVACVAPVATATALTFDAVTHNSIAGSFTAAADADSYLVILSSTATLGATPADNTAYTAGTAFGNGTVLQAGAATTFTATALTPLTDYYIFVYAYQGECLNGPLYNTTALTGTATTIDGPVGPTAGAVYITEVSDNAIPALEFLELYNNTDDEIDLTGSKLKMLNDDTVWTFGGTSGTTTGTAIIPARGFAIITRGGSLASFETAFGTLNANTVLIEGSTGMFFGTSSARRWQILDAANNIVDDTEGTVGGNNRDFQNILTGTFIATAENEANPGELDYLLYKDGSWTNAQALTAATGTNDAILYDAYTTTESVAAKTLYVAPSAGMFVSPNTTLTIEGGIVNQAGPSAFVVADNAALLQAATATSDAITVVKNSNPLYRFDYTLWSAPTTGQTLRQFSMGTSNNRFYEYVSSATEDEGYYPVNPLTTSFTAANAGKGFLIRMPNSVTANGAGFEADYAAGTASYTFAGTFTGVPNTGDISYPLYTEGTRYTAVGNPYPSPINVAGFYTANSAVLDGASALYFWRKKNSALVDTGSYATLTLADFNSNDSGDNGENATGGQDNAQYYLTGNESNWAIAPGQGFIIQTLESAPANPEVSFTNAIRQAAATTGGQSFFKSGVSQVSRFRMRVTSPAATSQMSVVYMPEGTLGLDYGYDGKKLTDSGLSLYTVAASTALSIQARPEFEATDIVPVGFKAATAGSYTIALSHTDGVFANGQTIYLKDKAEGVIRDMSQGSYTFTTEAGTFETRFEVVYTTAALGTDTPVLDANTVIVYQNGGAININSGAALISSINVFDIRGTKLYSADKVNATTAAVSSLTAAQQVLIVEVNTDKGSITKKIVF